MTQSICAVYGDDVKLKDTQDLYVLAEKISELPAEDQPKLFFGLGAAGLISQQVLRFGKSMRVWAIFSKKVIRFGNSGRFL